MPASTASPSRSRHSWIRCGMRGSAPRSGHPAGHARSARRSGRRPVRLAVHRTTLEALTNVRKHADAANVEIELAFRDDGRVHLRVHDDGRGAADETAGTGFGLKGIRERAEQLQGSANYRTAPSEGFTLYVELPACRA